jgi:hypothetical protein
MDMVDVRIHRWILEYPEYNGNFKDQEHDEWTNGALRVTTRDYSSGAPQSILVQYWWPNERYPMELVLQNEEALDLVVKLKQRLRLPTPITTFERNRVEEARELVLRANQHLGVKEHLLSPDCIAVNDLSRAIEMLDIVLKAFDAAGIPPSPPVQDIFAEKCPTIAGVFVGGEYCRDTCQEPCNQNPRYQAEKRKAESTTPAPQDETPWYKVGDIIKLGGKNYKVTSVEPGPPLDTNLGAAIGDAMIDSALAEPGALRKIAMALDTEITLLKARASELERDRGVDYHNLQETMKQVKALEERNQEDNKRAVAMTAGASIMAVAVHDLQKRIGVLEGSYVQDHGKLLDLGEYAVVTHNELAMQAHEQGVLKECTVVLEKRVSLQADIIIEQQKRLAALEKLFKDFDFVLWHNNINFMVEELQRKVQALEKGV